MNDRTKSFLALVIAISMLLLSLTGVLSTDGMAVGSEPGPTRNIFKESESNDNWGSADLISNQTSSFELHGNSSSERDNDYFYIHLDGGNGNNVHELILTPKYINTGYFYDFLFVLIYALYPDNDLNHQVDDERVMHLKYYDQDNIYTTWQSARIKAPFDGIYGIRIVSQNGTGSPISQQIEYNFTVNLNRVSSTDNNNLEDNPTTVTSGRISESLDQNEDMFDWFDFTAPHPIHPTTLDLTLSLTNTFPQTTSQSIHYGVEIDIYVKYNSRSNPNTYNTDLYQVSSHITFQNAGLEKVPFNVEINKNCTRMVVGLTIRTFGLSSSNPVLGQKSYTDVEGETDYTLDLDIIPDIPNNRPVLLDGKVEPKRGNSETLFQFSVVYRDQNNETPAYVNLWIDGNEAKQLTKLPGETDDLSLGARYGVKMTGQSIGSNAVHSFNFSASDGEDIALFTEGGLGPHMGPRIDDNLIPYSVVGSSYTIDLEEDREIYYLDLDTLFSDPNPETVFEYGIVNKTGGLDDDYVVQGALSVKLSNGSYSKPNHVLVVELEEDAYGTFSFKINASDRGVNEEGLFQKYAEVEMVIVVEPINDHPVITRINGIKVDDWGSPEVDQGERFEVTITADDEDDDELVYNWDIEDALYDPRRGENYDFDEDTGTLWFIPDDGDVPEMTTTVTVKDSNGTTDSFKVKFWIENVNDPPTIDVPDTRSTIEGEKIYVNPKGDDMDLDTGDDFVTYTYDLGELSSYVSGGNIEFNPNTGAFSMLVDSEKMIGEWMVTFSISDMYGEKASDSCKFIIDNVNDIPESNPINSNIQPENLTVRLFTDPAEDEDIGSTLTYIWDFGDGSNTMSGVDLTSVVHTYANEGAYSVSLKVTDGELTSEVRTKVIKVTAPPPDLDKDDDGIPDEWELEYGLDPNDPQDAEMDPDDDGLTNMEEFQYFLDNGVRLNPRNPDTDGDGYKDGDEISEGYDPIMPGSHPEEKYAMLNTVMLIFGLLFLVISIFIMILFVVVKIRNRKKPVVAPAAASPVGDYQLPQAQSGGIQGSETLPPADVDTQGLPSGGYGYQEEPVQGGQLPPVQPEEYQQGYYQPEGYQEPQYQPEGYQEPMYQSGEELYQDSDSPEPTPPPGEEYDKDSFFESGYGEEKTIPEQQEPPGDLSEEEGLSDGSEEKKEEEEKKDLLPHPPPPPGF